MYTSYIYIYYNHVLTCMNYPIVGGKQCLTAIAMCVRIPHATLTWTLQHLDVSNGGLHGTPWDSSS